VATQEADEAARIIDRLPAEQRLAALASVKDMEDNLKSSVDELRGRMQYLLELVQDVSGIDARAEVERRFNVRI
jgi:hypothetical protein